MRTSMRRPARLAALAVIALALTAGCGADAPSDAAPGVSRVFANVRGVT